MAIRAVRIATAGSTTVSGVAPAPSGMAAFCAQPTPSAATPPTSRATPATSTGRRRPATTTAAVTTTIEGDPGQRAGRVEQPVVAVGHHRRAVDGERHPTAPLDRPALGQAGDDGGVLAHEVDAVVVPGVMASVGRRSPRPAGAGRRPGSRRAPRRPRSGSGSGRRPVSSGSPGPCRRPGSAGTARRRSPPPPPRGRARPPSRGSRHRRPRRPRRTASAAPPR